MKHRRLAALGVFVFSLAVLLGASTTQGNVRDEGFYFNAAEHYGNWYVELVDNTLHGHPGKSLSKLGVDRGFSDNHEHPALMKTLFGLSWRLFHKCDCPHQAGLHPIAYKEKHHTLGLLDEETAFRLPTHVLTAAMITVVFLFGLELSGGAAFAAAGMTLFSERLFFDAQLACFDAPIAAMWVFVVYGWWRSRTSGRWGIGAGVLLGLALATKHNAFFIPPVLILVSLVIDRTELRAAIVERRLPRGAAFPRGLLWMAVLGPVVYLACWPWLWYSTVPRFSEYVAFHVHHVYYNFEYLGRNFNKPPFPKSFVFVMTMVTVPTTTLLLAAGGLWIWLRDVRDEKSLAPCGLGTLVVLNAAAPMLVLTLTGAPIFGATKHFHASIPFLALLAGYAIARLCAELPSRVLAIALPLVVVLPSAIDTWHSHPYGLSHYVPFVGGPDGGATLGMNRQFWGYATRGLFPYMNAHAKRNAIVYFHDTNQAQLDLYLREGILRRDIHNATLEEPGVKQSSMGLVLLEKHFSKYEYWFWDFYGTTKPRRYSPTTMCPRWSFTNDRRTPTAWPRRHTRIHRQGARKPGPPARGFRTLERRREGREHLAHHSTPRDFYLAPWRPGDFFASRAWTGDGNV